MPYYPVTLRVTAHRGWLFCCSRPYHDKERPHAIAAQYVGQLREVSDAGSGGDVLRRRHQGLEAFARLRGER